MSETLEEATAAHYAGAEEAQSRDILADWGIELDPAQEELEAFRLADPAGFAALDATTIGLHAFYQDGRRAQAERKDAQR